MSEHQCRWELQRGGVEHGKLKDSVVRRSSKDLSFLLVLFHCPVRTKRRRLYFHVLKANDGKCSGMRPSLGGIQLLLLKDSLLSLPGSFLILKHSSLLLQLFVLGLQVPLHLFVASLQLKFKT